MTAGVPLTDLAARVQALLDAADAGPWYFDGRDIFHKQPGTNLDQIIVPLGHVISDTYTADGAVNPATCELMATAPELLAELLRRAQDAERACEKAIRERRSLEIKEDDWHSAYERAEARAVSLEQALRDFAEHGTRFDCNPTVRIYAESPEWVACHGWWVSRATEMDASVRRRAREALVSVSASPTDGEETT